MHGRPVSFLVVALFLGAMLGLAPAPPVAAPKRVEVGPNVWLEVDGTVRRVVVPSSVCLRKGRLEGLVTRAAKGKSKDHEYVLAADIDARHLHAALILANARKGSPVRYEPKYAPPRGTAVRITLRYQQGGKTVTVPAGRWFRHVKTGKPLELAWVFAGSFDGPNPEKEGGPAYYMANHGAVISVCNVESAVLDLPYRSPKPPNQRHWKANTEAIPDTGTRVELILEPVMSAEPGRKAR
jgi:hypothetical protein